MLLNQELQQACENGEMEKVQSLLAQGKGINAQDKNGHTPLCIAIDKRHVGIAELLIENGADVNTRGYYNQTPLYLAINKGLTGIAKLLINKKANVDDKDDFYYDQTPLHLAAKKGYKDIVELLINNKANVNVQDRNGYAPLHFAAEEGHIGVVELLLKHGANVNVINRFGCTPPHLAAQKGHNDIAELLIENVTDVNFQNGYGYTPLHWAILFRNTGLVNLLIKREGNVNVQDRNGHTPLHCAAKERCIEAVRLLLKNEANVNVKSDHGFFYPILEGKGSTPLQTAVESGCMEILFLLLLFGADISAEDRIKMNGNPKLASCLEEFERIKAIPLFDRMIEAHKGGNIKSILPLINNREALIKDLQEIEERCNSNEQLSFISQYLYDFMKYMEPKIKQAYKIKKCKTKAVSSLINTRYENIKLSPKLSIISKILLWIKQCFYKIMPFLTKNIDDAPPKKQCHNNNFHDVAGNIAQYLSTQDLQNLALACKDINISVNNEKEYSEKRINRSMDRLTTDVKQVLDEPTTIGVYGSFIER